MSPEFLSDTLLTTFRRPPLLLIEIGSPSTESLKVLATWILVFVLTPVALVLLSVIAKYTVLESKPSGKCPLSLITLTDSPLRRVCTLSKVIVSALPPSLRLPILLIPVTLWLTVNDFSELSWEPGITIRELYSVTVPAEETRIFKLSLVLAPNLYPSITFSGGASWLLLPYR